MSSCSEDNLHSIGLKTYLTEQLGDISDLCALGDFLMKIGEYKKAEKYYNILKDELDLPEKHLDRAKIYNRLGIIRHQQDDLEVAIVYFQKAINAAPTDSDMEKTARANVQVTQEESKAVPAVFLGKRLVSTPVVSKALCVNKISEPTSENNLGHVAYHRKKYDKATEHYKKAISIMKNSEYNYIHEISCVYNNLGAVAYDQECYDEAKKYFLEAIFTLQKFTSNHPWIVDYKENLVYAQKSINKRIKTE